MIVELLKKLIAKKYYKEKSEIENKLNVFYAMRIYTSYFANIKTLEENNIYPVGICNKVPQFFGNPNVESVAPSNSILYEYKNSAQTDADREHYKER